MKVWSEIEDKLAQMPSTNRAKRKFLMRTSYYGQTVELDGQGRLLLPTVLREAAQTGSAHPSHPLGVARHPLLDVETSSEPEPRGVDVVPVRLHESELALEQGRPAARVDHPAGGGLKRLTATRANRRRRWSAEPRESSARSDES